MKRLHDARGVSLIDCIVALTTLGLLAVMIVPEFKRATTRARTAATMNLMLGVRAIVMGHRPAERKTLPELSLLTCLYCAQNLTPPRDLRRAKAGWSDEIAHDWGVFGYAEQPFDAWNRPLAADANELELAAGDCRHDAIWSAGENGIFEGVGPDGDAGVGDDLVVGVPFYKQTKDACGDRFY